MFFIWDIIFGTGLITRKFPESYGMKSYKQEEWYAQFLWPIFKSKKEGSSLAEGVLSLPSKPKAVIEETPAPVLEQV